MKYIGNSKKDKLNGEEQLAFLDYLKHSLDNGFSLLNSIELMPALWPKRRQLMDRKVGLISDTLKKRLLDNGISNKELAEFMDAPKEVD